MRASTNLPAEPTYLLLGPAGVRHGAQTRLVKGRRQNILFAALALRPNGPVDTDELLDAMWEAGPPRDACGALQSQVSRLRTFLCSSGSSGGPLRFANGNYYLAAPECSVDAFVFEQLARTARQLLDGEAFALARRTVEQALSLWRGRPFPELAGVDFAAGATERLEELRLEALVIRVQSDLALGRAAHAVISLRSLTSAYPLREDLWALLVRGLYQAGRTAEALAAHRAARATLVRELGLEPGPLLQGLEAAILRRDPALAAPEHSCSAHSQLLAHTPRPLSPLRVPGPDLLRELAGNWQEGAAVRLFLDRARAALPDYDPEMAEAADILRLCRLLRGDPLQIELAASQLPHRSVRQLVETHQLHPRLGRR